MLASCAGPCLASVMLAGCAKPAEPELDLFPFVDVWAWPTAGKADGARYVILQGDASLCDATVRGPEDADFAGGEWSVADGRLTLTRKLQGGVQQIDSYAIVSIRPRDLRLKPAAGGGELRLTHSGDYTSCSDLQTRFGLKLKIR